MAATARRKPPKGIPLKSEERELQLLVTTAEAAAACRMSEGYIKKALRSGELRKVKHGRATRIRIEDLRAWNARNLVGSTADPVRSWTENQENQVVEKTVSVR